jgi:hypothetical protein
LLSDVALSILSCIQKDLTAIAYMEHKRDSILTCYV